MVLSVEYCRLVGCKVLRADRIEIYPYFGGQCDRNVVYFETGNSMFCLKLGIRLHDANHKMVMFSLLLFSVTFLLISLPYYFIPYVSL